MTINKEEIITRIDELSKKALNISNAYDTSGSNDITIILEDVISECIEIYVRVDKHHAMSDNHLRTSIYVSFSKKRLFTGDYSYQIRIENKVFRGYDGVSINCDARRREDNESLCIRIMNEFSNKLEAWLKTKG